MAIKTEISRRRAGLALLLAVVVIASTVGPALAAPRVFVASASLEQRQAVTGETVDLSITVRNTGDQDGATRADITANGEVLKTVLLAADAGETRTYTKDVTFEEPGEYAIRVEDKNAGTLRVARTIVETTNVRTDGRDMLLRAGNISEEQSVTAEFPATNDTVEMRSLTSQTSLSGYERDVSTYTNLSAAPVAVPAGNGTTVFGAVTVESVEGVTDQRVRIAVNQSTVAESPLESDEVGVYGAGDDYPRANTTLVNTTDSRYVYEATVTDTGTLYLGSIEPDFAVDDYGLTTTVEGREKRITVTANVTNSGVVAGNYTATMEIDGEPVSNETVTVGPGQMTQMAVVEGIQQDGNYRVTLDGRFVGTVVVATGDAETATPTPTATPTTTDDGTTATGTDASGEGDETRTTAEATTTSGDSNDPGFSLPSSDIGVTEIGIGVSVAIIGVILVLLRRL